MNEARRGVLRGKRAYRKLQGIAPHPMRVLVGPAEQDTKYGKKYVKVAVRGGDFYDPSVALAKQIQANIKAEEEFKPAVQMDPASVSATPPSTMKSSRLHSTELDTRQRIRAFVRRAASITGVGHLRCWCAGWRTMFFLYHDYVMLLAHHDRDGWSHMRVPVEGIDWQEYRRKHLEARNAQR